MDRMLKLLLSLCEMKNWRLYGHHDSRCPPAILVWHMQVDPRDTERLARAISTYRGRIKWALRVIPHGWAVVPTRLLDLVAERGLLGFLAAIPILRAEYPNYVWYAHQEIEALADHVSQKLEHSSLGIEQSTRWEAAVWVRERQCSPPA